MEDQSRALIDVVEVRYSNFLSASDTLVLAIAAPSDCQEIRADYYALESLKREIDSLIYNWCSTKNWRKKSSPWVRQGKWVFIVSFDISCKMLFLQNKYRAFLFEHQKEIFGP